MEPTPSKSLSTRNALIAFLIALVSCVAVVVTVTETDDGEKKTTIEVTFDTLDANPDQDKTVEVPTEAIEEAEEGLTGEAASDIPSVSEASADHTGLVDETPVGVPPEVIEANVEAQIENRATTEALPTAGASGGVPGCVTSFVRNQSSRRGVRPTVQVLHYTVSPNRPGRSDVNGITAYFNRSSSQASSHFVIDAEGNCNYIVPIEAKAWTQGGGNPYAVSYEIIATGRESNYLQSAGYAKLKSVMKWVNGKTKIPLRTGKISGCSPTRSGIVQHAHGGTCWGGHHDIGPFNFSEVVKKVAAPTCNTACQRNHRHKATHNELQRRRCGDPQTTRSERCKTLHRRNAALHKVGVKPI